VGACTDGAIGSPHSRASCTASSRRDANRDENGDSSGIAVIDLDCTGRQYSARGLHECGGRSTTAPRGSTARSICSGTPRIRVYHMQSLRSSTQDPRARARTRTRIEPRDTIQRHYSNSSHLKSLHCLESVRLRRRDSAGVQRFPIVSFSASPLSMPPRLIPQQHALQAPHWRL